MSGQDDTLQMTVKVPITQNQKDRFFAFLEGTGRKAGPFLKVVIMQAVEDWESCNSGHTQVDIDALKKAQ